MESPEVSNRRSQAVAEYLTKILRSFLSDDSSIVRFVNQNIRKIAHAVEYCALGIASGLMLIVLRQVTGHMTAHAFFLVLSVAVIDESIQIFTDRGAMVEDILLDFCGGTAGLLIVLLLYGICVGLSRRLFS